jgi:hypothetical protein
MLIIATLDGYSPSLADVLMHEVVADVLDGKPCLAEWWKSSFLRSRSREIARFIRQHRGSENDLLLVGKSLGAWHMIERVLNPMAEPLGYGSTSLLTVDPNKPTWRDWSPNLNDRVLHLTRRVDRAVNVYVIARERRQQAGALVEGPPGLVVENVPVVDADHYSIVGHPVVKSKLKELVT